MKISHDPMAAEKQRQCFLQLKSFSRTPEIDLYRNKMPNGLRDGFFSTPLLNTL
jgi:hypothetical protein